MIRKDMYITEKQDSFIKEYLKNEGGGSEAEIMRKALDSFISSANFSSLGFSLDTHKFKKFYGLYIELSPRGAGKTYRLIKHATEFLEDNPKNKVNLIGLERNSRNIKQAIGEYFKNRVFIKENWKSDPDLNIKCYYDDFDYYGNIQNKEPDECGYYCSTPAKIRNLWNLDPNDFLIKLLNKNCGQYSTYNIGGIINHYDWKILREAFSKEEKQSETFQKEYLCKWIEG